MDAYAQKAEWVRMQAGKTGGVKPKDKGRTALIEEVLTALIEDRVFLHPRSTASAFPAEERVPGESPDAPALIYLEPENRRSDETPDEVANDGHHHLVGGRNR